MSNEKHPRRPAVNRAPVVVSLIFLLLAFGVGAWLLIDWRASDFEQDASATGGPQGGGPRGGASGGEKPGMNVMVSRVRRERVIETVRLVSTVEPLKRSTIGSEEAGRVRVVHLREGDAASDGQVIVELHHELLDREQAQAQSTLESLKAKKVGLEAQVEQAGFELERLERLETESRATERELVVARAVMARARSELSQTEADIRTQSQRISFYADKIAKTQIKAPFAGQVTQLMTEAGQWLAAGSPVAEIVDIHQVFVVVDVPQRAIDTIYHGMPVTVQIADLAESRRQGRVERIIAQADPQTRTFPVKILVDNDQRRSIKPGMFATAMLPLGRPADQMLVPRSAIEAVRGQGEVIYLIGPPPGPPGGGGPPAAPGADAPSNPPPTFAYRTPVLAGAFYGDYQAVVGDGLEAGRQVVVRGNEMLSKIPAPMLPVAITGASESARLPADLLAPSTQPDDETVSTEPDAPAADASGGRG